MAIYHFGCQLGHYFLQHVHLYKVGFQNEIAFLQKRLDNHRVYNHYLQSVDLLIAVHHLRPSDSKILRSSLYCAIDVKEPLLFETIRWNCASHWHHLRHFQWHLLLYGHLPCCLNCFHHSLLPDGLESSRVGIKSMERSWSQLGRKTWTYSILHITRISYSCLPLFSGRVRCWRL